MSYDLSLAPAAFAGMRVHADTPVPYAQAWNGSAPDWSKVDPVKMRECIRDRLCGVCGKQLGYWLALIGGNNSVAHRVFADPPMHEECAVWSVRHCPHLRGIKVGILVTRTVKLATLGDRLVVYSGKAKRVDWVHT